MRGGRIGWALAALGLALVARGEAAGPPTFRLPPGFHVSVFADGLGSPRFMALDPAGTVLLSIPTQGRVVALPDRAGDGRAAGVTTVVEGLDRPHGLAFHDGKLLVAETGRVLRFDYDAATRRASQRTVLVPDVPAGGGHWTRTIVFGRDGALYLSVGSSCNVCRETDPRRAAIVRYDADGRHGAIFASGLRNAVGLAIHPATGGLWATVNERDWRGDDLPPDYVTEVKQGAFHGWPDCYTAQGRVHPDPDTPRADCRRVVPPTLEIQAHSAPIGLAFYTGQQFPAEYRGDLFVAYRGSWNRSVPTGYKIVRVRFRDGRPTGSVEDFATGWLSGGAVLGRPVDLLVAPDGALLLTDQGAGAIYRFTYR